MSQARTSGLMDTNSLSMFEKLPVILERIRSLITGAVSERSKKNWAMQSITTILQYPAVTLLLILLTSLFAVMFLSILNRNVWMRFWMI